MFIALCIVATPFVFAGWLAHRVLEHRARMAGLRPASPMPALQPPIPTAHDVEQRLANLEAIVASLDFDLATRVREAGRSRAA